MLSTGGAEGSGRDAPGLKEKAGRAGERDAGFPSSASRLSTATMRGSIADRGRLPLVRGIDDGPEEDDGRAGKTNGGLGGGFDRGQACDSDGPSDGAVSPIFGEPGR